MATNAERILQSVARLFSMSTSLYFLKDSDPRFDGAFGIKPYSDKYWTDYQTMRRPLGLKKDLGWKEPKEFEMVFKGSDIWPDFPAVGLTLRRYAVHARSGAWRWKPTH